MNQQKVLVQGYIRSLQSNFISLQHCIPNEIIQLIYLFYHSLVIHGFGQNLSGQLGIGHKNPVHNKIIELENIANHSSFPTHIYLAYKNYIIHDTSMNALFTVGHIASDSLNIGPFSEICNVHEIPLDTNENEMIVDCIGNGIRSYHSIIALKNIRNNNQIFYGYGKGKFGQFGENIIDYGSVQENKTSTYLMPKLLPNIAQELQKYYQNIIGNNNAIKYHVCQISCGSGYTVFRTWNGDIFGCGCNGKGQLGIPSCSKVYSLTHMSVVMDDVHFIDVQTGYEHTLLVSNDGQLYVCGSNEYGQLGIEEHQSTIDKITLHPYFANSSEMNISRISVGNLHSLCIVFNSEKSECFCWGWNEYRQCSISLEQKVFEPCLYLPVDGYVGQQIIDGDCGNFYSVLVTEKSKIIILSSNTEMNEAVKKFNLENRNIVKVLSGMYTVLIFADK